jgi:hypothetical protein
MGELVEEITGLLRQDLEGTLYDTMTRANELGVDLDAVEDFALKDIVHAFAAGLHGLTEAVLRIAEEVERLAS